MTAVPEPASASQRRRTEAQARDPQAERGYLGRVVRETWVAWALEQPDPKPSWLVPWDQLDDGQREVDMRIGEAIVQAQRDLDAAQQPQAAPSAAFQRWFHELEGDALGDGTYTAFDMATAYQAGQGDHTELEDAYAAAHGRVAELEDERDALAERLGKLEDAIGNLAAGLKLSAQATAPSKKSDIEQGCADALLGILDPR